MGNSSCCSKVSTTTTTTFDVREKRRSSKKETVKYIYFLSKLLETSPNTQCRSKEDKD